MQQSLKRVEEVLRWVAEQDGYDLTIDIWEIEKRSGVPQEDVLAALRLLEQQRLVTEANLDATSWRLTPHGQRALRR